MLLLPVTVKRSKLSVEIAGPLTETLLMGTWLSVAMDIRKPKASGNGFDFPGRYIKLLWDGPNMKIPTSMMPTSL